MELRHVRYFLAIAEEGSFTRAAERLGIAQPPLSQQIKVLEREIGARLFRRLSHGVELTPAGSAFRAAISGVPQEIAEGTRLARKAAAGESGVIRIGFTGTAALSPVTPACIRLFRNAYPDVEIKVTEANSVALADALIDDRLDIAILRPSSSDPEALAEDILAEEPLVAALPAVHPLATIDAPIDLVALRDDPFIFTPRDVGVSLHDAMLRACASAGFTPKPGPSAPHIASILSLVAADLGVSLVPQSIANVRLPGTVFREIDNMGERVAIALAYRRATTSTVVRNFRAVMRQVRKDGQLPGVPSQAALLPDGMDF
ncbi:LysR family transcriptional regulator [Neorhizobium sp. NCHU2750]|uniref:LysR family transcriptional regulator n=1 Tax=Neorhizobium sp. NCHU2750 TaxID=1825976 RepID=UPI000E722B6D|nr:LysR family transcriptional regulator [Neorhizobium sp. NCHU2750]